MNTTTRQHKTPRKTASQRPTRVELSIPSELGYERLVRAALVPLGRCLGFDGERMADVQTAVSEACINAIEHGNQGQAGLRVNVTVEISPNRLSIVVADQGLGSYADSRSSCGSIEQKMAGLARHRGMGLLLIQQLVDEAGFLPRGRRRGNRYRLVMYQQPRTHT